MIDERENQCLIVVNIENHIEMYLSEYYYCGKVNSLYDMEDVNIIHFPDVAIFVDGCCHTIEIEEIDKILSYLIYHDKALQLKDGEFPGVVRECKKLFRSSKSAGYKASMITPDYCKFDIKIDKKIFSFEGKVKRPLSVDTTGYLAVNLSEKEYFLNYILDDRFMDMTCIMPFDDAVKKLKRMCQILVVEEMWKGDSLALLKY